MKIFNKDENSTFSSPSSNKNLEVDRYKTTNVNVLLNRVKLDRKKSYRKKILFPVLLFLIISAFAFLIF